MAAKKIERKKISTRKDLFLGNSKDPGPDAPCCPGGLGYTRI